jgi:hypothetical protein
LSRNLKYLKENLENKLNGMVRILGRHGDLDERETPMFSFSSISERFFIKIENRVGERIHHCLTPKS